MRLLLSLASLSLAVGSVGAVTKRVPSQYGTIQAGINAASHGDTVLVADGIYTGTGNRDIDFGGKRIVVKSENGPDSCIIDCQGSALDRHRGFYFHNSEDSTAVLAGFTICNGYQIEGGALYVAWTSTSPTITANIIKANSADMAGGGISCYQSSPRIVDNQFIGNSGSSGGAISLAWANPLIHGNTFIGNSAQSGGAIDCSASSDAVISNNLIVRNTATAYDGGGIKCASSSPEIRNNTICSNVSGYSAAALSILSGNPTIRNTLIWANKPLQVSVAFSSPTIGYCDIQGSDSNADGNISEKPLFLDPHLGNYNVCSQSPCVDAGDPAIQDPDGSRSDIGVFFETHPECFVGNSWHVAVDGNDTTGDGSPGAPFATIQHAIDTCYHGDTIVVQPGRYVESTNLYGKTILLTSNYVFSADSLHIEGTVIDGDSATAITLEYGEDSTTTISGFSITGGSPGVYCWMSDPVIISNIITENLSSGVFCRDSDPMIIANSITENLGSGVFCRGSAPTIISNNIASNRGSGVDCREGSNALIQGNTVNQNSTEGEYAGIRSNGSSPTVLWNTITGNSGGGIYCANGRPLIRGNLISLNTTTSNGAGIYCSVCRATIDSNTITLNSADGGGGIFCISNSDAVIEDNLISHNTAGVCGGVHCAAGSDAEVGHNVISHNSAQTEGGGLYIIQSSPD